MRSGFVTVVAWVFILFVAGCALMGRPTVTQLTVDPPIFMLAYPLLYAAGDGKERIEVPKGFVTDLASIPRELWWWQAPHEGTMGPAIVHDFLYWEQPCSKNEADAVMFVAMKQVGMSGGSIEGVYLGIRSHRAQEAWDRNQIARAKGEPRFFNEAFVKRLMDGNSDPKATLASIQADAIRLGGTVKPTLATATIKAACQAVLRDLTAQRTL